MRNKNKARSCNRTVKKFVKVDVLDLCSLTLLKKAKKKDDIPVFPKSSSFCNEIVAGKQYHSYSSYSFILFTVVCN